MLRFKENDILRSASTLTADGTQNRTFSLEGSSSDSLGERAMATNLKVQEHFR